MRELLPAQEESTTDSASLSGQTGYTSFSYCYTRFLYLYVGTTSIPLAEAFPTISLYFKALMGAHIMSIQHNSKIQSLKPHTAIIIIIAAINPPINNFFLCYHPIYSYITPLLIHVPSGTFASFFTIAPLST